MYTLESLVEVQEFELFLFGGIPESAQGLYERDFSTYSDVRNTRETSKDLDGLPKTAKGTLVGEIVLDPATKVIVFREKHSTKLPGQVPDR